MLLTTTPTIEGKKITKYYGIVTSEVILGANVLKDFMASVNDFFGGRTTVYENTLRQAKEQALEELKVQALRMGANAIVGIDIDYETLGDKGTILMVACGGTAVLVE